VPAAGAFETPEGRPNPLGGSGGVIHVTTSNSTGQQYGAADSQGVQVQFPDVIILAHELCGHAFFADQGLMKPQPMGVTGRPWRDHNQAIDMQNAIASEIYGPNQMQRGTFQTPRGQGASCQRPPGGDWWPPLPAPNR